MGFLDEDPDLDATKFDVQDLGMARQVLVSFIQTVDPAWLKNPFGPLALQWKGGGQWPATYLIHVAQTLHQLDRSLTAKSVPIFRRKVQELLRPARRPGAFEELFSELEVGALLSQRASPISFEPLVPTPELLSGAEQSPRSPDFGIRLPDGDVCFEVTNVHIGYLDAWDALMSRVSSDLSGRVLKLSLRRRALLRFPFGGADGDMSVLLSGNTLRRFEKDESGSETVRLPVGEASIEWGAVPHFQIGPDGEPDFTGAIFPMAAATAGGEPGPAASIEYLPAALDPNVDEIILRSVRNSLRSKRKQMEKPMPYVLVARLGHHRLNDEGIGRLLHERIFPNPDHAWITAIALFAPARNWEIQSPDPGLLFHLNENSRFPASPSLMKLMEGTGEFHLP